VGRRIITDFSHTNSGVSVPIDVPTLLRLLRSRQAQERWQAALALGDSGDVRAIAFLQQALNDRNAHVRSNASWSLARLGPAALPILLQALQVKNAKIHAVIPFALAELGDWRALDPLLTALKDTDSGVRAQVVMALAHFPNEQTFAALNGALYDPDAGVQRFAVAALRRIGDPAQVEQLIIAAGYAES
jgi:HEAT repeat protein